MRVWTPKPRRTLNARGGLFIFILVAGATQAWSEDVSKELQVIDDFYRAINSVHLRARADISRTVAVSSTAEETRSGVGTIEYWAVGDRFRRDTRTSPELGLIDDMDAAYDGSISQVMRYFPPKSPSTDKRSFLSLFAGRQPIVSPLPNPLFLPVDFVKISVENCPACQPELSDLRNPLLWARATADAQVLPNAAGQLTLQLPTGFQVGKSFSYVLERDAESALPTRVWYRGANGDALLSILMTSQRDHGKGGTHFTFPTRFRIQQAGPPQGWEAMTFDITIEELTVNSYIDPDTFKLDRNAADVIWDQETQTYLKTITSQAEN